MIQHKTSKKFDGKCEQAVIFARVSSERQEKGASIDAQLESIYNYCDKKGFKIIKEFTITESSSRGDRKQYKEMLDFIKRYRHKVAIVVNCVDRLQRSYKDTPVLDEMRKQGLIEVHFLKENLILRYNSSGSEILFWNLHVLMANSYVLALSDNVKRSLRYNRSIGKWMNRPPIGYMNVRNQDGKADIVLDPERAPIVKKAFEMYATGNESIDSVLSMTRQEGLTTTRKILGAKPFTRTGLRKMLGSCFYYGMMLNPDPEDPSIYVQTPHIYEPLISKALFDRVQEVLEDRVKKRPHPNRNGEIPFAFRGLIRCGDCGYAMTTERHTKKSGRVYFILRCSHKKHIKCNQPLVNQNIILNQLNQEVFSKIKSNAKLWPVLQRDVRKYLDEESNLAEYTKRTIQNNIKDLKNQSDRLLDLYVAGKVTEPIYQSKSAKLKIEINEAQKQIDEIFILSSDIKSAMEKAVELMGNISELMLQGDERLKNQLLQLLLENCVLNGKKLNYKIRKPFDILLYRPKDREWMRIGVEDMKRYQIFSNQLKALPIYKEDNKE